MNVVMPCSKMDILLEVYQRQILIYATFNLLSHDTMTMIYGPEKYFVQLCT